MHLYADYLVEIIIALRRVDDRLLEGELLMDIDGWRTRRWLRARDTAPLRPMSSPLLSILEHVLEVARPGDRSSGFVVLSAVLHAAGAGDRGLLVGLDARRINWMYAPKAFGAWHLHGGAATTALEARVFFSSVGSALGNVGQANYAAGNACLDALALSQRLHGLAACAMQWPLIGGAGMGAEIFTAVAALSTAITGMAGISLEEYAACLSAQLGGGHFAARGGQLVASRPCRAERVKRQGGARTLRSSNRRVGSGWYRPVGEDDLAVVIIERLVVMAERAV